MVSAAAERGGGLDSPVPGGTPTPSIGYSLSHPSNLGGGGRGQLFVVLWKGLGVDALMVVMVTATVVKRIPRAEWLPAVAIRR
ncbi:hypothetical protein E3N88_25166 [Mikania micrantha]|uniref:Uncharacterized protein n=1 Tax=Mikania micrantha TaxID=192012 RepID=A0A5N6N6U3_9ASTR|nr:hypothetical protein E3N88_25166 [Mikania micrantha]